jgi:hypothetical protein
MTKHTSLKGLVSESHLCVDCRMNTAPELPTRVEAEFLINRDGSYSGNITWNSEVYMVRPAIWKNAGMEDYGGCLCVGCLEKRIGRKLRPKDFRLGHPFNAPDFPASARLCERQGRPWAGLTSMMKGKRMGGTKTRYEEHPKDQQEKAAQERRDRTFAARRLTNSGMNKTAGAMMAPAVSTNAICFHPAIYGESK